MMQVIIYIKLAAVAAALVFGIIQLADTAESNCEDCPAVVFYAP